MKAACFAFQSSQPISTRTSGNLLPIEGRRKAVFLGWLMLVCYAGPAWAGEEAAKLAAVRQTHAPVEVKDVDVQQFEALRQATNSIILDVRTPNEFALGHIPGAVNLNWQAKDFAEKIAALDKRESYLVHCAAGARSAEAPALARGWLDSISRTCIISKMGLKPGKKRVCQWKKQKFGKQNVSEQATF
jgi:rhodanese-related sulfurtransferase